MITDKMLEQHGYKFHKSETNRILSGTEFLFQKRIKNTDGDTLYFINVWYYPEREINEYKLDEAFMVEATIFLQDNKPITLKIPTEGFGHIVPIETVIQRTYDLNHCIPDPHNND